MTIGRAEKMRKEQQKKVNAKLEGMTNIEKVSYILSNHSSYAMFDKELATWYIQELIKMNGGPKQFQLMFPPELKSDILASWSTGRRSPTPFTVRMMISHLENKLKHKVRDTDSFALRQELDKMNMQMADVLTEKHKVSEQLVKANKRIKRLMELNKELNK